MGTAWAQETDTTQGDQTVQDNQDVQGEIDVNPASIFERIDSWVDGAVRMVPNIITALIVLALAVALGYMVRAAFLRWARGRDRGNLGTVFGGFLRWLVIGLGVLLALTIVVPTLNPGDLIAGLGVGSVAIGFAFKDILQNWLAGMLLLFRQPFEIGDQIIAQGYEGTVERIETRVTTLKTYDGRLALIPNSEVYTNSVLVNTAFEKRRSQYDVGIGYNDDVDQGVKVMLEAVQSIDGVLSDPAPEVICSALGDWSVVLRARWWTDAHRKDVVHVKSDVMIAIKKAMDAAGIDMPYETQVHLWHDQTEETDGIRSKQREGWPAKPDEDDPGLRFSGGFSSEKSDKKEPSRKAGSQSEKSAKNS